MLLYSLRVNTRETLCYIRGGGIFVVDRSVLYCFVQSCCIILTNIPFVIWSPEQFQFGPRSNFNLIPGAISIWFPEQFQFGPRSNFNLVPGAISIWSPEKFQFGPRSNFNLVPGAISIRSPEQFQFGPQSNFSLRPLVYTEPSDVWFF